MAGARAVAARLVAILAVAVAGAACSGSTEPEVTSTASSTVVTTAAPGTDVDVEDAVGDLGRRRPRTTTTTEVAADAVRSIDFADFTYEPDSCLDPAETAPWEVVDGTATNASGARLVVTDVVVDGDVTGDGVDDAVVLVACDAGGNAGWQVPLVYTVGADGDPERLGVLAPGEDRQVTGVSISDGQIVTDDAVFLPDDPRCCPSATGATIWGWDGSSFTVVNATEAGRPDDGTTADPFLITISGVGPFQLGLSKEALAALGVDVHPAEPQCGPSTWEATGAPDGLYLVLDTEGALRAVSVSSPAYLTAENANVDSFSFDLQSVYPDLEWFDFGTDDGAGQYAVIAPDRSSGIFFTVSDDEVVNITVTWGDAGFMDLC